MDRKRKLLTISEAADFIGISQNTLRKWTDRGKVPHVRLPSGYRRYRPEELAEFVRQMEHDVADEESGKKKAVA